MVKKWSVSYPAVTAPSSAELYVYLPSMYEADRTAGLSVHVYVPTARTSFLTMDATLARAGAWPIILDYTTPR